MRYMKYIKFTCSNGFFGCDEEIYEIVNDNINIDEFAYDVLENDYSFAEPDGRFVGKSWNDELTEEECEEYIDNLSVEWEEITKEEYEENC